MNRPHFLPFLPLDGGVFSILPPIIIQHEPEEGGKNQSTEKSSTGIVDWQWAISLFYRAEKEIRLNEPNYGHFSVESWLPG